MSRIKESLKRLEPRAPGAAIEALRPRAELVALTLIDEPALAMRETMDPEKLRELIESMRAYGQIQPIAVQRSGKRYRVLAGHRRYIAARELAWATIQCMVYPEQCSTGEAIKAHENAVREHVNAAEEARWLARILESECGGDTVTLADRLGMRVDYVEERLNLFLGDEDTFTALKKNDIGIGVARELNLVRDPLRRKMLLHAAVEGGCSVRQMQRWRTQGNAVDELNPQPPVIESVEQNRPGYAPQPTVECAFCGTGPADGAVETLFVHRACMRHFERELARLQIGQDARGAGTKAG